MNNLDLWESVERTDPKHTKPITGKQYRGNSPKPYWLVRRATETFGPCGIGWGFEIVEEKLLDGAMLEPGFYERIHMARVRVWYEWDGKRGQVEHVGETQFSGRRNNGNTFTDEDAPKKSVTDALVKALSMIGFAGDIFLGRFDDSKYVQETSQAFREEEQRGRKSSAQAKRDNDWEAFQQELSECATTVMLQRLHAEYRDTIYPQWKPDWIEQAEEAFEKREAELGEPVDLRAQLTGSLAKTKADYIRDCHEKIADFDNAKALGEWWNDTETKAERKRFSLTPEEVGDLKGRVMNRRDELVNVLEAG